MDEKPEKMPENDEESIDEEEEEDEPEELDPAERKKLLRPPDRPEFAVFEQAEAQPGLELPQILNAEADFRLENTVMTGFLAEVAKDVGEWLAMDEVSRRKYARKMLLIEPRGAGKSFNLYYLYAYLMRIQSQILAEVPDPEKVYNSKQKLAALIEHDCFRDPLFLVQFVFIDGYYDVAQLFDLITNGVNVRVSPEMDNSQRPRTGIRGRVFSRQEAVFGQQRQQRSDHDLADMADNMRRIPKIALIDHADRLERYWQDRIVDLLDRLMYRDDVNAITALNNNLISPHRLAKLHKYYRVPWRPLTDDEKALIVQKRIPTWRTYFEDEALGTISHVATTPRHVLVLARQTWADSRPGKVTTETLRRTLQRVYGTDDAQAVQIAYHLDDTYGGDRRMSGQLDDYVAVVKAILAGAKTTHDIGQSIGLNHSQVFRRLKWMVDQKIIKYTLGPDGRHEYRLNPDWHLGGTGA